MKSLRTIAHHMALDAWTTGTVTLLLCLALELLEPGFVSRFFNLLWLLLFVVAASFAALATQPRAPAADEAPRPANKAQALLCAALLLAAPAAWFLLPESVRLFWRAAAAGSILVAVLTAWPILSERE